MRSAYLRRVLGVWGVLVAVLLVMLMTALAEPFEPDIESDHMNVFINENGLVEIEAAFSRSDFCGSATSNDGIEVIVIGLLNSSQNFYGTDTIKIINKSFEKVALLAFS